MPFIPVILVAAFNWLFRAVLIKALIGIAIFAVISIVVPLVVKLIGAFLNVAGLNDLLLAIPSGIWYFWGVFRFDVGLKLTISAYVTRFLIRRIPVVG